MSKLQYQLKAAEKSPERPKKKEQVLKIEQKGKVIEANPLEIAPASEFQKMTDSGHMQVINKLREENRQLKDSLIQMQEAIQTSVNSSIAEMKKLKNIDSSKLNKIVKKCQISEKLDNLEIPQNNLSVQFLNDQLKHNVSRFKKFTKTVVNPSSIASLINEFHETHIKDVEIAKHIPKSPRDVMDEINQKIRCISPQGNNLNKSLKDVDKLAFVDLEPQVYLTTTRARRGRNQRSNIKSRARTPEMDIILP